MRTVRFYCYLQYQIIQHAGELAGFVYMNIFSLFVSFSAILRVTCDLLVIRGISRVCIHEHVFIIFLLFCNIESKM